MKVHLQSVLAVTNIESPPKSHFSDIYSRVCKSLGLQETWYFGLGYRQTGRTREFIWLDTSRKVLKKLPAATKNLIFQIKYYPEDVGKDLIENITIQIFYMEIKREILNGNIDCPAHTAALLASYLLQIEYGNHDRKKYEEYLRTHQNFLPLSLIGQYNVDSRTWTKSIADMWQSLAGIDPEDAMVEYLKLAQNLDMYGVTYFNIRNKKKTKLLLGVSALGLNIYDPSDKLTPRSSFSWSEIKKLKFKGKQFTIKFSRKKIPNLVFHTMNKKKSKAILSLGNGNRDLYFRRRKPDSQEIMVLKEKAKGVRALREKERDKLQTEVSHKKDFLRREEEYHHQLRRLQEDLELTVRTIQTQVLDKLEETKKLQKEFDKAKEEQDVYDIQYQRNEKEKLRQKGKLSRNEQELEAVFYNDDMQLPELAKVDEKLQDHLKSLQRKLQESIYGEEITQLDILEENRDKYKTLSDIRGENINNRIKMFQNM